MYCSTVAIKLTEHYTIVLLYDGPEVSPHKRHNPAISNFGSMAQNISSMFYAI